MHESKDFSLLLTLSLVGFLVCLAFLAGPGSAVSTTYESTLYFPDYEADLITEYDMWVTTGVANTESYFMASTRDHILITHRIDIGGPLYWFINSALQPTVDPTSANYKNYWGTSTIPTVTSTTGFAKSGMASHLKKIPLIFGVKVVLPDGTPVAYTMEDCVYACVMNGYPCVVIYNEAAYRQNSAGADYQWFGGTSWTNVKGQTISGTMDYSYNGGTGADWQVFDAQHYSSSNAARTWKYKTTVSWDEYWFIKTNSSGVQPISIYGGYYGYKVSVQEDNDELVRLWVRPDGIGENGFYHEEAGQFGVGTWYQTELNSDGETVPYNPYYPPTVGAVSSSPSWVEYSDWFPIKYYNDGEVYRYYKYRALLSDDISNRFKYGFSLSYSETLGKYLVSLESVTASSWYYTGFAYDLLDYIEEEEPEVPVDPSVPDVEQKEPIEDGTGLPNIGFYPVVDFELSADLTGSFNQYLNNPYLGISEAYYGVKDGIDGFVRDIMEIPFYALKTHIWDYSVIVQDYTRYVVGIKEDYAVPFYNLGVSLSRFVPSAVWYVCSVVMVIFAVVAVVEIFTGTFSDFIRRRML